MVGSFDCVICSPKGSVSLFLISGNLSSVYRKQSDWPICRIPGLNGRGLVNLHFSNPAVHFGSPNNLGRLHCDNEPSQWMQSPENKTTQHNNDDYWSFHPLGQKCLTASRNVYVNTISIEGGREIRCDIVVSVSNESLWYWASHTFSCEELLSRKTKTETITYAPSLCPGFLALFLVDLRLLNNTACWWY